MKVIKVLNSDASEQIKNKMSNIMMTLPYMYLQFDGNRADKRQCDKFIDLVMNDQEDSVTVRDFKKKTLRKKQLIDRKYDFVSRCHKEADRNVQHGDFGKAMESLRKIDAKINYENVVSDINSSLPARFIYCVLIKDMSQFPYFLVYAYHRTDGSLAHIVHVYFTFLRACFGRAIMFMCVI